MEKWIEENVIGQYVADQERRFYSKYAGQVGGLTAVQMGQLWLRPSEELIYVPENVRMRMEAMAWGTHTLDMLLLPHSHEFSQNPLMVLHEAARVLKPDGKLILTGFNLHSLWFGCKWFDGDCLPEKTHCLTLPVLKKQIDLLGFEIEYGQFMVYVPPVKNDKILHGMQFLEKAGDRWWPQCAAIYGLVLVKRVVGVTPLPEWESILKESPVALGVARVQDET